MKEIEKLTKEKYEKELTIDQLNQTIDDYKSLIEKFTEKLESFLNEKDNLTKMIEDIEVNNKKLAEKLTTYK
jgi:chromosome segregation ATPase